MAAPSVPNWQAQILHGLGAPVTPQNLLFLNNWTKAEGGNASYNPFNTTQNAPGATSYNSVGVRNYVSPQQGINATVQTLLNGRYGNILSALRQGTDARAAALALANSPWGTGSLVLKMLGGNPGPSPSPVPSPGLTAPPATPQKGLSPELLSLFNQGNQLLGLKPLSQAFASAPPRQPTQGPSSSLPATPAVSSKVPSARGKRAVNLATQFLGVPYVWGGESTKGFDCSGLLQYVWAKQGVQIPRTTYDQFKQGTPVPVNQLQAGDAVFFKGSDSKNGLPGHVGIYLGGGKFIEAPHTGANVRISSLAGRTDFQGARRYA